MHFNYIGLAIINSNDIGQTHHTSTSDASQHLDTGVALDGGEVIDIDISFD